MYSRSRAIGLLRTLDASRTCVPPGVSPPTQYCLQLYSSKINSQHTEVCVTYKPCLLSTLLSNDGILYYKCLYSQISTFCSRALLNIRLHLHCSPPSLNFTIQPQPEDRSEKKKKEISARNRAALISLLGADKFVFLLSLYKSNVIGSNVLVITK